MIASPAATAGEARGIARDAAHRCRTSVLDPDPAPLPVGQRGENRFGWRKQQVEPAGCGRTVAAHQRPPRAPRLRPSSRAARWSWRRRGRTPRPGGSRASPGGAGGALPRASSPARSRRVGRACPQYRRRARRPTSGPVPTRARAPRPRRDPRGTESVTGPSGECIACNQPSPTMRLDRSWRPRTSGPNVSATSKGSRHLKVRSATRIGRSYEPPATAPSIRRDSTSGAQRRGASTRRYPTLSEAGPGPCRR